jgi:hypothetical protein
MWPNDWLALVNGLESEMAHRLNLAAMQARAGGVFEKDGITLVADIDPHGFYSFKFRERLAELFASSFRVQTEIEKLKAHSRRLHDALLGISNVSANENSEPDAMGEALAEIQRVVECALNGDPIPAPKTENDSKEEFTW